MNVKLIANGKTIDYEISDDEFNRLFKRTGLEKPKAGEAYYVLDFYREVANKYNWQDNDEFDEVYFKQGLIFTDKKLAQDRSRARKIKIKLERFASEHNKSTLNWNTAAKIKWCLYYNFNDNIIDIDGSRIAKFEGTTYFSSGKIAKQAIEELDKDGELTWYLRDYQPWISAYEETEEK